LAYDFHVGYLITFITSYKKSLLCVVSDRNQVLFMCVIPNTEVWVWSGMQFQFQRIRHLAILFTTYWQS